MTRVEIFEKNAKLGNKEKWKLFT